MSQAKYIYSYTNVLCMLIIYNKAIFGYKSRRILQWLSLMTAVGLQQTLFLHEHSSRDGPAKHRRHHGSRQGRHESTARESMATGSKTNKRQDIKSVTYSVKKNKII